MKIKGIISINNWSCIFLLIVMNSAICNETNQIEINNNSTSTKLISIDMFFSKEQKSIIKKGISQSKKCSASKFQQGGNGPAIIGEYIENSFASPSPYSGTTEANGEIVWETIISYPGASYIAPFFKSMELNEDDELIIRSPDKSRSWTYTKNGPRDLGIKGGFWGIHIHGDTAIIELHSKSNTGGKGLYISRFARGYTLAETTDSTEAVCTTDDSLEAKCYQGSQPDMYDKSRAVARLIKNGNAHCTGWLVGDEGHLLTNEHCIANQAEADQITIEFMAEGPDCATNCQSALGCPGTVEATSPTLVKNSSPLDYALILPTSTVNNLPNTYGFMQLRETGAVLSEQLYIPQHPSGWGKRIAFASTYPDDTTGFGVVASLTEAACSGGANDVGYWLDTRGGSSGSPVLGFGDHKVVALHHCRGDSSCTSGTGSDDPNRGVPIQAVIADLGTDLPNGATCDSPNVPTAVASSAPVNNQISVSWIAPVGGPYTYEIYRAIGNCSSTSYSLIASNVAGTSYNDTDVSGGSEYAYKVKTYDSAESCSSNFSTCSSSTATGLCTLAPTFSGISQASNLNQTECTIQLDWNAATQNCGTNTVFNVYRSTTASFTPSLGNLVSSCETGTSYVDSNINGAIAYNYIVRAEDDSTNGAGLCAAGNEDLNIEEKATVATGPNSVAFADNVEAGTPGMPLAGWAMESGEVTNSGNPWAVIGTNAHSGTKSFYVSNQDILKDQVLRLETLVTPQAGSLLEFWHRYDTETSYDGGALEYSTDGGTTWHDILDGNGGSVAANINRFIMNGYDGNLNTSASGAPLNGRPAWHGDNGTWEQVQVDLQDFVGETMHFRWRMSCDGSIAVDGWYIDDITVITPSMCLIFDPDRVYNNGFESN